MILFARKINLNENLVGKGKKINRYWDFHFLDWNELRHE